MFSPHILAALTDSRQPHVYLRLVAIKGEIEMSDKIVAAAILGAAIVIASIVLAVGMASLGNKIEKATADMRMYNSVIVEGGRSSDAIPIRVQEVK
jgi:hypothetical protein